MGNAPPVRSSFLVAEKMRLIVNPGLVAGQQEFKLKNGPNTIGRARENDIVILDQSLSRQHARIDVQAERISIADLQSRNGTFVNGDKVDQADLKNGDTIQWGDALCTFVRDSSIVKEISGDLSNVSIQDLVSKSPAKCIPAPV